MNGPVDNPLRTALLLVNTHSRQGGAADIDQGIRLLEQSGLTVIHPPSASIEETRELIDTYRSRVDLVIMGGGDGSISAVIDKLYELQLPLAVLPLGTANDFARSLDIPLELPEAFAAIVANHRARINLSKVNGTYFLNVAHIGLGVEVTHELTSESKARWGVLSYAAALLRAYRFNRSFRVIIRVDGRRKRLRILHLAIGNGRYYGGGNIIDDQSTLFDGKLSLYAIKPLTLWELMSLAPFLRSGQQYRSPRVFCCHSDKIRIETTDPHEIHADGEPVTFTPADFEVIPQALETVVGRQASGRPPP